MNNIIRINFVVLFAVITFSFTFFLISCEDDLAKNIGADLVVDRFSSPNDTILPISSSTFNIAKVRSSNQSAYLLGSYRNSTFGELSASVATNLLLPSELSSVEDNAYVNLFGDDYLIDAMVVTIPYSSTKVSEEPLSDLNNHPNYRLESIIGNTDDTFKIELFELAENIVKTESENREAIAINSDKVFAKSQLLHTQNFNASADDKFLVIDRLDDNAAVYARDSLKLSNYQPAIRFKLNASSVNYLKKRLIDDSDSSVFSDQKNFESYFNGFYIQTSSLGTDGHLMKLSFASSKLEIFYSVLDNSERVKKIATYNFGNAKANAFERNYTSVTRANDRLFVQGAAGEEAVILLDISESDLLKIRSENWLVTKASFSLFVDQQYTENIADRLYVYDRQSNARIADATNPLDNIFDGNLDYETIDNKEIPLKYSFSITEYVSEVLKQESTQIIELGVKAYNDSFDKDSALQDPLDYNWNPKGSVILNESSVHAEKKLQLELKFRKIN